MKSIFDKEVAKEVIKRIEQLEPDTTPQWGKMSVDQMLAHCNVAYQQVFNPTTPKAAGFKKFMLKLFVKKAVVGPKPYPKNGRTAPEFLITDRRDFAAEQKTLIDYIRQVQQLGAKHFDQKDSHSFGPLSSQEWNTLFYKHLDHHLTQFGV